MSGHVSAVAARLPDSSQAGRPGCRGSCRPSNPEVDRAAEKSLRTLPGLRIPRPTPSWAARTLNGRTKRLTLPRGDRAATSIPGLVEPESAGGEPLAWMTFGRPRATKGTSVGRAQAV